MWHIWNDAETFVAELIAVDKQLAERVRTRGCPCGGRLHRADYPRKPRGVAPQYEADFQRRLSFCCDRPECRRRRTPPSVRFGGRRVYVAALIVACCAGWTSAAQAQVPVRSVRRWSRFFRQELVATVFWQTARARLMPPVVEDGLPASLLERFSGERWTRLRQALEFLAPTTTRTAGMVMDG